MTSWEERSEESITAAMPSRAAIIRIIKMANSLMFPRFYRPDAECQSVGVELLHELFDLICEEISKALCAKGRQAFYESSKAATGDFSSLGCKDRTALQNGFFNPEHKEGTEAHLSTSNTNGCNPQTQNVAQRYAANAESGQPYLKTSLSEVESLAYGIVGEIPRLKRALLKDVNAIYSGDPAAHSAEEVILSYPGFYVISIYRLAHEFYIRSIPYIPRVMTEFAHEKTGIDIHPGAKIGESFCIDHGTGIVIGETATIGDRVKIYQGVTLGAKSISKSRTENAEEKKKRHPDIGDDTVIYANATILGGNTRVGRGCIIGGNVWLTHSIPDGEKVYYTPK